MKNLYKFIFFHVIILLLFNKMTIAQDLVRFECDFDQAQGKVGFYLPDPYDPLKGTSKQYKSILLIEPSNIFNNPYWSLRIRVQDVSTGLKLADDYIHSKLMDAHLYPEIHFQLEKIHGTNAVLIPNNYQTVELEGKLTYHGVTNPIKIPATLRYLNTIDKKINQAPRLEIFTDFTIQLKDYGINIPLSISNRVGDTIHLFVQTSTPEIL